MKKQNSIRIIILILVFSLNSIGSNFAYNEGTCALRNPLAFTVKDKLDTYLGSLLDGSTIIKKIANADDREKIRNKVKKLLINAIYRVYGKSGLSDIDLMRTYERAFYYWESNYVYNKNQTIERNAQDVVNWLKDEIRVYAVFGEPIGSRANYAIVRDVSQGFRIREIFEYVKEAKDKISRKHYERYMNNSISNERELLLVRMAQLEEAQNIPEDKRIAGIICNQELKKSIEALCSNPYKLLTHNVARKDLRKGKLWAGTNGIYGMLNYLGLTPDEASQMGIPEPEAISGTDGLFVGEYLVFFPNEQMSTLEPLAGVRQPVSAYHLSILFKGIMGEETYERFDGYIPFTIKYLFSGPGISAQIHRSKGLHGKPETFIMLCMDPELGEAVFGFKDDVTNDEIVKALDEVENGNVKAIIPLLNILSAKRGEIKSKDVLDIKGETSHTLGAVTSLDLADQIWIEKIINKGIMGILEIAYNQFAVSPLWVDPATIRIADPWVEKAKALLGAKVSARHMDMEEVKKAVSELKKSNPKDAIKQPDRTISLNGTEQKFYNIGPQYNFSIINFDEVNQKSAHNIEPDDSNTSLNVIMALGTTNPERERIEISIKPESGDEHVFILSRGEGLRIQAGFKGKIETTALDKGAWLVWVTVPKSEALPPSEDDLFVRRGMDFKNADAIKLPSDLLRSSLALSSYL